jgi:hypothetical protein
MITPAPGGILIIQVIVLIWGVICCVRLYSLVEVVLVPCHKDVIDFSVPRWLQERTQNKGDRCKIEAETSGFLQLLVNCGPTIFSKSSFLSICYKAGDSGEIL